MQFSNFQRNMLLRFHSSEWCAIAYACKMWLGNVGLCSIDSCWFAVQAPEKSRFARNPPENRPQWVHWLVWNITSLLHSSSLITKLYGLYFWKEQMHHKPWEDVEPYQHMLEVYQVGLVFVITQELEELSSYRWIVCFHLRFSKLISCSYVICIIMQSCRFDFCYSESLSQLIADESFHSILHSLLPLLFQTCIEVKLASVCGHGSSDVFQQQAFKAEPSRDPSLHLRFFEGNLRVFRYPWYLKTF